MPDAGNRVRIHYTGRLTDGTTFDSSVGGDPFEFVVGTRQVITGLDDAVLQMNEGESRTVTLEPGLAYGDYRPELAQRVQREQLPVGTTEGAALRADVGGQETVLWVKEIGDDSAVVDANHPLAGKTLVFDVELVSIDA